MEFVWSSRVRGDCFGANGLAEKTTFFLLLLLLLSGASAKSGFVRLVGAGIGRSSQRLVRRRVDFTPSRAV